MGVYEIHDDDCGAELHTDGWCPDCRFYPDMQSVALVERKPPIDRPGMRDDLLAMAERATRALVWGCDTMPFHRLRDLRDHRIECRTFAAELEQR